MNRDKIADLRQHYGIGALDKDHLLPDPIAQFHLWFEQAQKGEILEPNAMILSTIGQDGHPAARTVLLKELDTKGFVFYTNYESDKGKELIAHPQAALTFLWLKMERQIRIKGEVRKLDEAVSNQYFQSRPRDSQLGAWASPQSSIIEGREVLESRLAALKERYGEDKEIIKPPHWGGFQLIPGSVEFWQGRASRLHDRMLYSKNGEKDWTIERLAP